MKAWKSGTWAISGQALQLLITVLTLAILGRILSPEEFGIFGLVIAVQAFILPVLDMGLLPAFIKLESAERDASNAFFTINLYIGLLCALLILGLSPVLSSFYETPQLKFLLYFLGVSVILTSLCGQPQAVLSRNKKFDKIFISQVFTSLTGAGLVIILASINLGVFALAIRLIYEAFSKFILLIYFTKQKYRIISIKKIKPYIQSIKFGLGIVLSRIVIGFAYSVDKLILGKFISLNDFGGYTRAQQIGFMPVSLRTAVTTPSLAHLARVKSENKIEKYILLYWIVVLLTGIPAMLLMVYGDLLMPLLLGPQWAQHGWLLQWAGLFGFARILHGLVVIYHIDQKAVYRTTLYTLISYLVIILLPMLYLLIGHSFEKYTISLSILASLYWLIILWRIMTKEWENNKKFINREFLNILFFLFSITNIFLYIKNTLTMQLGNIGIFLLLLQMLCLIISSITLFWIISNKQAKVLLRLFL